MNYLDKLKHLTQRPEIDHAPKPSSVNPGDFVTWVSGGQKREAFVDWIHTDQDGKQWAFVSFGKAWAAVDRRLLTVVPL
jgi:hypothetical protein